MWWRKTRQPTRKQREPKNLRKLSWQILGYLAWGRQFIWSGTYKGTNMQVNSSWQHVLNNACSQFGSFACFMDSSIWICFIILRCVVLIEDKVSKQVPPGLGKDLVSLPAAKPNPTVVGSQAWLYMFSNLCWSMQLVSPSQSPEWCLQRQPTVDLENYIATLHKKVVSVEKMLGQLGSMKGEHASKSKTQST